MHKKAPPRHAVRPKLAASLLLIRQDANGPQILMGRRAAGHKFMPNKYVFPGGRVERADHYAPIAAPLPLAIANTLEKYLHPRRAAALAAAAIRETFEETGLMLARPLPRPLTRRKNNTASPWRNFYAHNLGVDLQDFHLVARAITPPYHGRRFDTWFFTAPATHTVDFPQYCASGELEDVHYIPLSQARSLDLPTITTVVLDELNRQRQKRRFLPQCFSMRYGQHVSSPII